MSKPQNIRQIADLAETSYATVSRVLNNRAGVKESTKARVLKVMKETGFTPNFFARSLQSKTTGIIGIIMSSSYEPTYSPILSTAEKCASERGHTIMVSNTQLNAQTEINVLEEMKYRGADGILLDPSLANKNFLEEFAKTTPIVLFNKKSGTKLDSFYVDNIKSASSLITALSKSSPAPYILVTNAVEKDKIKGWTANSKLKHKVINLNNFSNSDEFFKLAAKHPTGTFVFTNRQLLGKVYSSNQKINGQNYLPYDYVPQFEYREPDHPVCIFPSEDIAKDAIEQLYQKINGNNNEMKITQKKYDAKIMINS